MDSRERVVTMACAAICIVALVTSPNRAIGYNVGAFGLHHRCDKKLEMPVLVKTKEDT